MSKQKAGHEDRPTTTTTTSIAQANDNALRGLTHDERVALLRARLFRARVEGDVSAEDRLTRQLDILYVSRAARRAADPVVRVLRRAERLAS